MLSLCETRFHSLIILRKQFFVWVGSFSRLLCVQVRASVASKNVELDQNCFSSICSHFHFHKWGSLQFKGWDCWSGNQFFRKLCQQKCSLAHPEPVERNGAGSGPHFDRTFRIRPCCNIRWKPRRKIRNHSPVVLSTSDKFISSSCEPKPQDSDNFSGDIAMRSVAVRPVVGHAPFLRTFGWSWEYNQGWLTDVYYADSIVKRIENDFLLFSSSFEVGGTS